MPPFIKKTLYIGLGGTGVASLLHIKKCFIDSYGEIPPMVGFLAIDTDNAGANRAITGNRGQEIRLQPSELLICSVKNALTVHHANPDQYSWVPSNNVARLVGIAGNGAGQVRSNGRFIAYYNHTQITNHIQTAINRSNAPIPLDSPFQIYGDKVDINIIGSIAGGTGSGMLIDVMAITHKAMEGIGQLRGTNYYLYPWIILPEVFRAMYAGPAMHNVQYNTYGALRELDYLRHHSTDTIHFGHTTFNQPLFDYAYVINNTNLGGTTFSNVDELAEVVAKSAFLPSGDMGAGVTSPFDNIRSNLVGGVYDIVGKKAWAASTASAELIYDGQAVGRARAYRTISLLCHNMTESPTDGVAESNRFFDDHNVMIRENQGRDDVINKLLTAAPPYSLTIDADTQLTDLNAYIGDNASDRLDEGLKERLDSMLNNTKTYFGQYLERIMQKPDCKVGGAISFVNGLIGLIDACRKEMFDEKAKFHTLCAPYTDAYWTSQLAGISNSGIAALFNKTNQDAANALQTSLFDFVKNKREEIRRDWAIRFYNQLEAFLQQQLNDIYSLDNILKDIELKYDIRLQQEINNNVQSSKFQIFLQRSITDALLNDFSVHLKVGAKSWIGNSQKNIENSLWDYAKNTAYVLGAVNKRIEQVLQEMTRERVMDHLNHMKTLAQPMWAYDTQGFLIAAPNIDHLTIVGVPDQSKSYLHDTEPFNTAFDNAAHKATWFTTNHQDRIYLLTVEACLPIYAVANFPAYERDNNAREAEGDGQLVNYIDEPLYRRIVSENFSMKPVIMQDTDVLKYWVLGFVFNLIQYDAAAGQYWIRSQAHGDALDHYRFNLGAQRDVAFNAFRNEKLNKEVKTRLDRRITAEGRDAIIETIRGIQEAESYYEHISQLSESERAQINTPPFAAIRQLITDEINFITNMTVER